MSGGDLVRSARARGAAVLLVTFVSGALAGAAILHVLRATPASASSNASRPSAGPAPERVIENMKMARSGIPVTYEALGLTAAQRVQIARIMNENRPRTDSLLRETWPKLRALLDSIQRQVEQVLTPEQRARLAALRRASGGTAVPRDSSSTGGKTP